MTLALISIALLGVGAATICSFVWRARGDRDKRKALEKVTEDVDEAKGVREDVDRAVPSERLRRLRSWTRR